MCKKCDERMMQIDVKVPHFIDRLHGNMHGEGMPDSVYVPAREELFDFVYGRHGSLKYVMGR